MSISCMKAVWDCSQANGTALLVLLAIADNANDEGYAWPSIPTIARKARLSERQTMRLLDELREQGEIDVIPGRGRGHTTHYQIKAVEKVTPMTPINKGKGDTHDTISKQEKVTSTAEKVTSRVRKGDIQGNTYKEIEPSIEPSKNRGLAPLFEALKLLGLPRPVLARGEDKIAKQILDQGVTGEQLAECWKDIGDGTWPPNDKGWLQARRSFSNIAPVINNWLDWEKSGKPKVTTPTPNGETTGRRVEMCN